MRSFRSFVAERLEEALVEPMEEECFDAEAAGERIRKYFHIEDFDAAGLRAMPFTTRALGGLLDYLEKRSLRSLAGLNDLRLYQQGQYMELDLNARRNLELCETMRTKGEKGDAFVGS